MGWKRLRNTIRLVDGENWLHPVFCTAGGKSADPTQEKLANRAAERNWFLTLPRLTPAIVKWLQFKGGFLSVRRCRKTLVVLLSQDTCISRVEDTARRLAQVSALPPCHSATQLSDSVAGNLSVKKKWGMFAAPASSRVLPQALNPLWIEIQAVDDRGACARPPWGRSDLATQFGWSARSLPMLQACTCTTRSLRSPPASSKRATFGTQSSLYCKVIRILLTVLYGIIMQPRFFFLFIFTITAEGLKFFFFLFVFVATLMTDWSFWPLDSTELFTLLSSKGKEEKYSGQEMCKAGNKARKKNMKWIKGIL